MTKNALDIILLYISKKSTFAKLKIQVQQSIIVARVIIIRYK